MWWLYFVKCVWRCGGCTLLSVFEGVVVVHCEVSLGVWWLYFTKCVWRCGGCTFQTKAIMEVEIFISKCLLGDRCCFLTVPHVYTVCLC